VIRVASNSAIGEVDLSYAVSQPEKVKMIFDQISRKQVLNVGGSNHPEKTDVQRGPFDTLLAAFLLNFNRLRDANLFEEQERRMLTIRLCLGVRASVYAVLVFDIECS
jgi:hypothetical protein